MAPELVLEGEVTSAEHTTNEYGTWYFVMTKSIDDEGKNVVYLHIINLGTSQVQPAHPRFAPFVYACI